MPGDGRSASRQHGGEDGGRDWGDRMRDLETETTIQAALLSILPSTGLRVDVDADNGIVYLRGEVASDGQREEAEKTVRDLGLQGVRRIENELVVNPCIPPLPHP